MRKKVIIGIAVIVLLFFSVFVCFYITSSTFSDGNIRLKRTRIINETKKETTKLTPDNLTEIKNIFEFWKYNSKGLTEYDLSNSHTLQYPCLQKFPEWFYDIPYEQQAEWQNIFANINSQGYYGPYPLIINGDEVGVHIVFNVIYHKDYEYSPWAEVAEYGICCLYDDEPMKYAEDKTNLLNNFSNINYLENLDGEIYTYIIYYAKMAW